MVAFPTSLFAQVISLDSIKYAQGSKSQESSKVEVEDRHPPVWTNHSTVCSKLIDSVT